MAYLELVHIPWETTEPTIVLTDNKSVTRFLLTKALPPALWNSCEYVLLFKIKIVHITGTVNTTVGFLSKFERKVTEKVRLKIREEIQTTPIEETTSSSVVNEEEQFLFTQSDNENESDEQISQRKQQPRIKTRGWVANAEPSSWRTSVKEFANFDGNTTSYSMNGIKASARWRASRTRRRLTREKKTLKIRSQLLWWSADSLLMNCSGTHTVNVVDILELPRQRRCTDRKTTTQTWRNKSRRGSFRVRDASRNHDSIGNSPVHPCKTLANQSQKPGDGLHIDLVPELLPSGGYQNNVTAVDVFLRYLSAYSTMEQDAKTSGRVKINIMVKDAYLPTAIVSDKGSAFLSQLIKEVADVLGITLEHATTELVQIIGMPRKTNASLKKEIYSQQPKDDQCGTSISTLLSQTTTRPTTRALGVNLLETDLRWIEPYIFENDFSNEN